MTGTYEKQSVGRREMANFRRKQSVLFLAGAAVAALPAAATAQDSAEDTSGDIIVTAQRQEQRLQDVPVSVTAFGAEQLRDNSIETVQDIALRTPGLAVNAVEPVNTHLELGRDTCRGKGCHVVYI